MYYKNILLNKKVNRKFHSSLNMSITPHHKPKPEEYSIKENKIQYSIS